MVPLGHPENLATSNVSTNNGQYSTTVHTEPLTFLTISLKERKTSLILTYTFYFYS